MSIAMGSGAGIGGTGFVRGIGCVAIYDSAGIEERKRTDRSPSLAGEAEEASSSSSSVGEDSDDAGSGEEDEEEVQGECRGPLHGMQSLEESLPFSRGISSFYNGKSKSFTSLSDAAVSCVSAKDLSKDENAYTRKRRNLLALKTMLGRPHTILKSSAGCINRKLSAPARSASAIAAATGVSPRLGHGADDPHIHHQNILPPRPGKSTAAAAYAASVRSPSSQQFSFPSRSFSLGDLSQIASLSSSVEDDNSEKKS